MFSYIVDAEELREIQVFFFSSPGTSAASGRAATFDCADSGIPPMLGV
jgi:hypothetical protein